MLSSEDCTRVTICIFGNGSMPLSLLTVFTGTPCCMMHPCQHFRGAVGGGGLELRASQDL